MLILAILLGVLLVGVCSFVAGQSWGKTRKNNHQEAAQLPFRVQGRSRNRIKRDLDGLLLLHREGHLTEEQLLRLSDRLIDELSALGAPEPSSIREGREEVWY